jgi:hypothetical protein
LDSTVDRPLPDPITRAGRLPSLPRTATELLRLATDAGSGVDDYVRLIRDEPVLAARILGLANSSLFSLGREVTTLDRAATVLGTKSTHLMALSCSIVEQLRRGARHSGLDHAELWKRSLILSVAARELGRLLFFALADEAFLCGLLSHLGQLVLAECMPEEYDAVLDASPDWPTAQLERELLGFDRGDVAAALLTEWRMPRALCLALGCAGVLDRLPADAGDPTRSLATVMHVSEPVVGVLCNRNKGTALEEFHAAANRAGLRAEQADTFLIAIEGRIAEAANLLEIDLGASATHAEILADARSHVLALDRRRHDRD